jgi:hypothetical protein
VFFLSVPPIVDRFGSLSIFAVLAALCTAVFLLLAGVPVGAAGGSEVGARDRAPVTTHARLVRLKRGGALPNTGAAVLSLCAAALLFAGQSSVNASLVPIGAAVGLSVLWVGRVMALGLLASLGGAAFARVLGERAGLLLPLVAGAGVLGSAMLLVTLGGGAAAFVGSAMVLFMGIVFVGPYVYALLAGLDEAGRWASIGPAFVLTGWALGPGIAGVASRGSDFTTLGYAAAACLTAAVILLLCAQRLHLRAEGVSA